MGFEQIAVRENRPDVRIDKDWFNSLRQKGIDLETFVGLLIPKTTFPIANNQGVAANVTGLVFNPATAPDFEAEYRIYRNTTAAGATELSEKGTLMGIYSPVAGTWEITQNKVGDAGVTFTITNAGQMQYTSTNITGTPATSEMKFKAKTMGV